MQYLSQDIVGKVPMKRRNTDLGFVLLLPYRQHHRIVTLPTLGGALFRYLSPTSKYEGRERKNCSAPSKYVRGPASCSDVLDIVQPRRILCESEGWTIRQQYQGLSVDYLCCDG